MSELYLAESAYLWLLAVVLPLLFLLNYFTYRRKKLTVGSLFLWRRVVERIETRTSSKRRLFSVTLLLLLLAATSFIFALSEPTVRRKSKSGLRLLLIRSAATMAQSQDGTVFEDIVDEAKRLLSGGGLIHTLPPSPGEGELSAEDVGRFLDGLEPSHLPRPEPLPYEGYDVVLSNRKERTSIPTVVLPARSPNAAVTSLGAEEREDGVEMVVRVLWTAEEEKDAELLVESDSSSLSMQVRLKKGENIYRIKAAKDSLYKVTIRCEGDPFALDDVAYINRLPDAVERVAFVGEEQDDVLRALVAAGADVVRCMDEPQGFRMSVYYRRLPARLPDSGTLLLIAPPDGMDGWFSVRSLEAGRLIAQTTGLFVDPNALSGVKVAEMSEVLADDGVRREVHATDGRGAAVIAGLSRGALRIVVVGFDVGGTEWTGRASFPVFFALLLASTFGDEKFFAPRVGESIEMPLGGKDAEITSPSGKRTRHRIYGGVLRFVPDEVGVWRIRSDKGDTRIGVSLLRARESNIEKGTRVVPDVEPKEEVSVTPFWELPLLLGLLLLGFVFIKFSLPHRRA